MFAAVEASKILIIEDSAEVVSLLERVLGEQGYDVSAAVDGNPGLARALDQGGSVREPNKEERRDAALEHLDWLVGRLGPRTGLRHARKHLAASSSQRSESSST